MSSGLKTELMFNALDSLLVILFTVFHQPLVPVPCFYFQIEQPALGCSGLDHLSLLVGQHSPRHIS